MDRARLDDFAPLLDPTQVPRVVTRAQALALGFTKSAIAHRLRTRTWRRILPRTYLTGDTLVWDDRLRAALAFCGPGALLTGAAALDDLGLRAVHRPSGVVVLVPMSTTVRSIGWVRVRRTRRTPLRALRPGPARAGVARALADLAVETPRLDDVRMLVTEAVRRRLCTVDELRHELDEGPRRGSANLRLALEDAADSWSAPEARAAGLLRTAGLGGFEQNARIVLPDGSVRVVDFLWRALRAVLEIDSDAHHALAGDADGTADRHLALTTAGFSVVHRTPRLVVRRPAEFTAGIAAWLAARARELGR